MQDIWYMLQDQDRYVYHYTKSSTLAEKILPAGNLLLSKFKNVNDPRESKDWVFAVHDSTGQHAYNFEDLQQQINSTIKHSWRLCCFVTDPYEALATRKRENAGENIHTAAYERGHSRPRMWAQYAEDWKGACLVFDKAKLDERVRKAADKTGSRLLSGKVKYENQLILPKIGEPFALGVSFDEISQLGIDRAMANHISRFYRSLFLTKATDWAQEREFRWLVHYPGEEDFFVEFADSLVGLALGDKFPDNYKPTIGSYAEQSNISLSLMNWQNGFPQHHPMHWRWLMD